MNSHLIPVNAHMPPRHAPKHGIRETRTSRNVVHTNDPNVLERICLHPHRKVSIPVFHSCFSPCHRVDQFPPYLRGDLRMLMRSGYVKQCILLIRGKIRCIPVPLNQCDPDRSQPTAHLPLAEHKQTLVPQHRQFPSITQAPRLVLIRQPYEVENESINHLVWKGILLIQQDANKQ